MEQSNSDTVAISSENQITDKLSTKIQVSSHYQCNARRKLEDRLVVENDLNSTFDLDLPHKYRYYAIFDGHVNELAAEYCKNHLHLNLIQNDKFKNGEIKEALKETFVETDQSLCDLITNKSSRPGTTALVCLIEDDRRLYVAWAGDSTSILIRDGQPVLLTTPHTPEYEEERDRVKRMGGECMYTNMWRVMGILGVSRSIGDPDYKPFVTAEPEVVEIELIGSEDFLIMGSDGLTDSLTPEEAATIVYEFLALNADQQAGTREQQKELLDNVSKQLIKRSIDEGSTDNITTIVIFLKDLAAISPSLKPIKQNGHQNGNHVNGHHDDELANQFEELHNGMNGGKSFPLNVNAPPFLPNSDIFSNIAMSSIESIRSMQQKAWENCTQGNINVTSNEDNIHDDNLQSAINDEMNNFSNENDEQPHSILPEINCLLTNESADRANSSELEDDLERELDEERLVVNEDDDKKIDELSEENEVVEELKELKLDEQDKHDKIDVEIAKTVECEYGVIPGESVASPVDLISESTTTDHNEHDEKGSNENLPNSPFEQIEETHESTKQNEPETDQQADVLIKVNDETLNTSEVDVDREETLKVEKESDNLSDFNEPERKSHEEDDKSEENSFEFIEHKDLPSQPSTDQNTTQYESPENSNLESKLPGLQECSVYENANPNFDNSILNRDLQYREQQLDDDQEEDYEHPFENDSEDSIKYLDKTSTERKQDQALDVDADQQERIDELADLMGGANISETNDGENISALNENINDQTLNLLEYSQDQENVDEQNKENLPQLIKPPQPTLLDSTLIFSGNPPSIISPTNDEQLLSNLGQINEDHLDDDEQDESNENQQPTIDQQPTNGQKNTLSNFELVKEDEILNNEATTQFECNNQDDQTNYKAFDMEITNCGKTEYIEDSSNSHLNLAEQQSVIDEQVPDQQSAFDDTEKTLVIEEQAQEAFEQPDTTSKNNFDESSSEYVVANQDPSFIKIDKPKEEEQIQDDRPELIEEPIVEETKDTFVVLESPPKSSNDSDEYNNGQLSELKSELIDESNADIQQIDAHKDHESISDNKIIDEAIIEKKSEVKSSTVSKAVTTAAVVTAAAGSTLVSKKKSSTSTSATKQPLSKAKPTKDTKPAIAKDSKSSPSLAKDTKTSTAKPTSTLTSRPTLTKRPATSAPATKPLSSVTRKLLSTATSKPASTVSSTRLIAAKKPTATLTAVSKSSTALTNNTKTLSTKPAVSKVSSTLKSTVASRLNTGVTSSRPTAKSSSSTSKPTVSDVKTKPATSRPAASSKYANVTSKVSSSLATAAVSTATTRPTAKVTGLATKKPASNTLKSTTTKPSTTSTANKLTNVASKVSSMRSTTSAAQSRVNSKPSTKPAVGTSTKSSTLSSSKKTTAVPRKPVNSQSNNCTPVGESAQKSTTGIETSPDLVMNNENNSNSIKPNSQLVNGQQTNSNLSNGDALGQSVTTPSSITSSKSRDKLTNSLKAELEAAMLTEGLPK